MQDIVALPTAVALGAGVMTLFAIIRRVMRAEHVPAFLASYAVAFGAALFLTACIALSLMLTAVTVAPYVGSIVYAAVSAAVLHLVYWSIVRVIIPVAPADKHASLLPPAAPAA